MELCEKQKSLGWPLNDDIQKFKIKPFEGITPLFTADTLVYHHVGSTGGTSFNAVMDKQLERDIVVYWMNVQKFKREHIWENLSGEDKRKYRFISLHDAFGMHIRLPQKCKYVSFLRDPVSHMVSHYYYFRQYPQFHKYKEMPFEQFVDGFNVDNPFNVFINVFARIDPFWDSGKQNNRFVELSYENRLKEAIKHIDEHFVLIGDTGLYYESLFLLWRIMGWDSIPYLVRENVTSMQYTQVPWSPTLLSKLKHATRYEQILYDIYKAKLLEQWESLKREFPGVQDSLEEYKLYCKRLNSFD